MAPRSLASVRPYQGHHPVIGQGVFLADFVSVTGKVEIGDEANVWYGCVLRGDVGRIRIGKRAIVSFPNFGHWRVRAQVMFGGKMPTTDNLPDRWYDTPNIHLCTIKDFLGLCKDVGAKVERAVALNAYGRKLGVSMPLFAQNLFYEEQSTEDAIALHDLSRKIFAAILRKLPDAAFDRQGIHTETGLVTLGQQVKKYEEHLNHHLAFIAKKRARMGK